MGTATANFYNDAYSRQGWAEVAAEVRARWQAGDRDGAAALVTDEMVLATTLIGTEDMVRARLRAWRDAGVDTVRLYPAGDTPTARLDTLARGIDLVRRPRLRHPPGRQPAPILAILMAMSVSEQMPLADVKNHLSEVVDRLQREHGRVIITRHGRPAAVVMSVEDLESLEETLDIMDSAALLSDIRESLAELGSADAPVLTKEDALRRSLPLSEGPAGEGDFAIAWTTASRRALTRLPEKVATAVVEFLYGSLAACTASASR